MIIARTVEEVRAVVRQWKKEGADVGLVPTMGYLHEGHASLMRAAAKDRQKVVVSIFVNPTQFGPGEDLAVYPRDFGHDRKLCEDNSVDMIFNPDAETMYPEPFHTTLLVSELSSGLCGRSRPVHFGGVCLVVCKLFNIVTPDSAYFGRKDAQQLAIIKQMTGDLNLPVRVVGCPIVREADGLAKSSRNAYLTEEQRGAALVLNRSLRLAEEAARRGEKSASALQSLVADAINAEPLSRLDYVEVVDKNSMRPVRTVNSETLIAVAATFGKSRLLDNVLLNPHGEAPA